MKKLRINEENNHKYSKKFLRLVKAISIICLAVFILEIWMMNRLSTYGNKIAQLKEAQSNLEFENRVLENLIAQNSSLSNVDKKAAELGFSTIKNIEYTKPANIASVR